MGQLATFKTPKNAKWFTAPGAYWHEKVFGAASS
jgi:hypothetical protein